MAHLSDDELQIWADGEASDVAQASAWRAHVDGCGACGAKLSSLRAFSRGMGLWAESVADDPAFAADGDLAERVMRMAAASAGATVPAATSATPAKAATPASNVVPMRAPKRRWAWGAAPIAIAAAAALVFAIKQPGHPRTSTHIAQTNHPGHPEVGQPPAPLEPDLASDVDPGSEVLAVQTTDEHTTYSVLELQMKQSGATTAVVWIDDRADEGSSAVQ